MEQQPQGHEHDLVEPEGVNAGSDQITRTPDEGDVVSGGRPEDAPRAEDDGPDGSDPSTADPARADEPVGTPTDDEREPGQPHGSSGQDAGLMD